MGDIDHYIETLNRCELIREEDVKNLCTKAKEILTKEPNVQRISAPVTVSN